jgi:two-component SAPR family response regulator
MVELLKGRSVLIVEDEFYLADDLATLLIASGAHVLGPFSRVEDAGRFLETGARVDLAILDIDLMGDRVFPVADILRLAGTPFLFATGYDREVIPERFKTIPSMEKPVTAGAVLLALQALDAAF